VVVFTHFKYSQPSFCIHVFNPQFFFNSYLYRTCTDLFLVIIP
jgi:hypothetical protein